MGICTKLPSKLVTTYMIKLVGAKQRMPANRAAPNRLTEMVFWTPSFEIIGCERANPAAVANSPAAPMRPTSVSSPKIQRQ